MDSVEIPSVSKEDLILPGIFPFSSLSGEPVDPRSLPVQVAFGGHGGQPREQDWLDATWADWTPDDGATALFEFYAPDLDLTVGSWDCWLRVTGGRTQPERLVCYVVVTGPPD